MEARAHTFSGNEGGGCVTFPMLGPSSGHTFYRTVATKAGVDSTATGGQRARGPQQVRYRWATGVRIHQHPAGKLWGYQQQGGGGGELSEHPWSENSDENHFMEGEAHSTPTCHYYYFTKLLNLGCSIACGVETLLDSLPEPGSVSGGPSKKIHASFTLWPPGLSLNRGLIL